MPIGLYVALSVLPLPEIVPNMEYDTYLLPGMLAYTIMTNGIYGLAYWMAEMRSRNVIKRFLVTPIKVSDLSLSLIASRIIIILVQITLLTTAGVMFFNNPIPQNFLGILILTVFGGSVFLLIGLLIANYSTSYETATPLTTAIGLPMSFLGGIFFPTEQLPHILKVIAKIIPITYLSNGLRVSYLTPEPFAKIIPDLFMLSVWIVILLVIVIKLFKLKAD